MILTEPKDSAKCRDAGLGDGARLSFAEAG